MEKRLRYRKKRKKSESSKKLPTFLEDIENAELMERKLSTHLDENHDIFKNLFDDCSDVVFRKITLENNIDVLLIFIDGMVDINAIHDHTIYSMLYPFSERIHNERQITTSVVEDEGISASQLANVKHYSEVLNAILAGDTAIFIDGETHALILNARGGARRGVQEPETEAVVRGPREGFAENIRMNTGLLRNKIKSTKLKTKTFNVGEYTRTDIVLAYIEGIIDPKIIEDVTKRLQEIKIDGVLESAYIEELIEDYPFSPFPEFQTSERPDTVAAQLLEGKFAIIIDGTPFVLIAPVNFWQLMQASEDYYERYIIANLVRWLRYIFIIIALYLPALYIAVTSFHQDMVPTNLLLSIAAARETIPFPALVEALIMEISFEALREAGIRLPKTVGQAVSIVGALVIGSAAVEAGIVSAPMVIVVALTGIATFTIPRYNMSIAVRMLRFPMMLLAGSFGIFGIIVGTMWIAIHLCKLNSFGHPYLTGVAPYKADMQKDIFVRVPWWAMIFRPGPYARRNLQRMTKKMNPLREEEGK